MRVALRDFAAGARTPSSHIADWRDAADARLAVSKLLGQPTPIMKWVAPGRKSRGEKDPHLLFRTGRVFWARWGSGVCFWVCSMLWRWGL